MICYLLLYMASLLLDMCTLILSILGITGSKFTAGSCDNLPDADIKAAQRLWNYMLLNHTLRKCDVIMVLGSYDVRVSRKAADLWLDEYGKWLVISGNSGNLTKNLWTLPEADIFFDVAVGRGVPRDAILLERDSTNTGQNVRNSHRLLSLLGVEASSFLLVQKPYMERRTYATFLAQWPGHNLDVIVTSPDVSLLDYPNEDVGSLTDVISVMMGDMQRIVLYGELGYQTKQHVPDDVQIAFDYLKGSGKYDGYFQ